MLVAPDEEYLQLMSIQFEAMRIGLKKVGGDEHRLEFMDQDVVLCPLPLALLDTVNSVDQEPPTIDASTASETRTDARSAGAGAGAGAGFLKLVPLLLLQMPN